MIVSTGLKMDFSPYRFNGTFRIGMGRLPADCVMDRRYYERDEPD